MDDKDIERILKDSANKTELMPSEERWNRIKDRLDMQVKVEEPVLQEVTVAASAGNANKNLFNSARGRTTFGFIVCCVCLILCLAIVLPIYFTRPNEHRYLDEKELIYILCSNEEFENDINNSKIELVSLSDYEINNTYILKTESGEVKGGGFDFNVEEKEEYVKVKILAENIKTDAFEYSNPLNYNINDTEILYKKVEETSILKLYLIQAKRKGVTYKIEYTAVEDNVLAFFDEFFK